MVCVITLPYFFRGENQEIENLLIRGNIDYVHLRKPESSYEEMELLLKSISKEFQRRIVLHDHHSLAMKYSVYGIHLNSRNQEIPKNWKGSISRSCHSLDEIVEWKDKCNYLSLSPIFDSISKPGYKSAFTEKEISQAVKKGIIDHKVLALGGITFSNIEKIKKMGFGGAMILSDAWTNISADNL